METPIEKHLALVGTTGIGKTYNLYQCIKAHVPEHKILFCRSLEDLHAFNHNVHTDIIFDDISFNLCRPELLITLCDKDFHCTVRILRKAIRIPPSVRKWFTHNNVAAYQPVLGSFEQQEAICRRLHIQEVTDRQQLINLTNLHISRLTMGSQE